MNNSEIKTKEYYSIDLIHLAKSLLRRAWVIVLSALVAAAIGFSAATFLIAPKYSSSIMLYVNNSSVSLGEFSISSSEISAAQSLLKTYIVMLQNRTTLNQVIEKSGVEYDYEQLNRMIDAKSVNNTEVLRVTVTSEDPYEAANIANCIAEVLPVRIAEIIEGASMEVVDAATVDLKKVSPSITKYTAIGLIAGVVLSAAALVLIAAFDKTVHNEEYLLRTYDYPILAKIPNLVDTSSKGYGYRYYQKNKNNPKT